MITVLFLIISVVFVGLGLPDSLFGAAWPAIYPEFRLPVGYASFVTMIISFGTSLASFFSARIINKLGTGLTTGLSTALTAAALLGFSFANSLAWLLLLALPLGVGAGAIDAALNNYVAVRYKSTHMNFLHCFYGVGVAASPYILSFFLSGEGGWRQGYLTVFFIQAAITVIAFLAMPLWNKVGKISGGETVEPKTLKFKDMAKMKAVRSSWVAFFSSCALEFTCGIWGCTYLVSVMGMDEAVAAKFITLYYIGITSGRFVSGLISVKVKTQGIITGGYSVVAVALLLLVLPLPAVVKGISLFMIGFGNGPTFPNLVYLTPRLFGQNISQSIVGTQMFAANVGICFMPPLFGLIAQNISVAAYPYFLIVMFALMAAFTVLYFRRTKKEETK